MSDVNNDIMCSTVAQEVEVVAEEDMPNEKQLVSSTEQCKISEKEENRSDLQVERNTCVNTENVVQNNFEDYTPPVIPVQKNSEAYNGAVTDKYSWSQTIAELGQLKIEVQ